MSSTSLRDVPTQHKVAALVSAAVAVFAIAFSLPVINGGTGNNDSGVPWGIVVVGFVLAVITFVAAYGVWTGQRWGVVLTIVMNALQFILGAPGIVFGSSAFLVVSSVIVCVANAAVIVLLMRHRSRNAARTPASQGAAA